ncbi:methyl-accepting chemotaxis protein [Halobacillus litoralis]|uniref:methyl-accepting chemotaxis protein n=1 Tax=Halobacillus litoralis TaxID=45668 RepID=UPI001CFDB237|nr:methyl-accepting chemotaxis protein [Halobacillus litoralis]WLR47798.1 methyl-accepting chemotaxis protein [Halobacillus litoralis]
MLRKRKKSKQGSIWNRNLQRQILIPFLTLITAAGIIIGYASYTFGVSITTDELTDNVEKQMNSLNDSFELFFQSQEDIVNHYSQEQAFINYASEKDRVIRRMDDIRSSNEIIKNAYMGVEESGETITDSTLTLPSEFDPRERPWYKDAVENGSLIWTAPYMDTNTNETIMSVARAVMDDNEVMGVFSIDLNMNSLLNLVEGVKIADSGYAAIFDGKGTFLSHPDPELVGTDVSEESYYVKIMEQDQPSGVITYEYDGKEKTLGYSINETTGWIIVGTVDKAELEEKGAAVLLPITITVLAILILSVIVSVIIARRIRQPITDLQKNMKRVEEGDLTVDLIQHRDDEIGQLSASTHEMKESIKRIIEQLQEATAAVSEQSRGLKQSADEVREGSEQIASTMEELSAGSESQAHSSSRLSEMIDSFVNEIKEAQQNGENVADSSQQVLSLTNDGSEMMQHSVNQMQNIDQIVKDAVEKVGGLDQQSQEISKLVQVIQDIAEQTNLLSLNAAIEAARAGEHGKGFAVVADEVRKLAEQVTNSVEDITEIVTGIQKESTIVVTTLKHGYEEVDQGTKQMKITGETFNRIEESVTDMVAKSREISDKLSKISNDSYEMNASIEEVASVSQESAAGVEQVTAAAQQSNSSVEEVSHSADELSSLSKQLNEQIRQFKVKE